MSGFRLISVVFVYMLIKIGHGSAVEKLSEQHVCNTTFEMGNGIYAVEVDFDFLIGQYKRCWTTVIIPDTYSLSYKIDRIYSITRSCNTSINVTFSGNKSHYYPFCNYPIAPLDPVILQNPKNVTFNFQYDVDSGAFHILFYIFQTGLDCVRNSVRCRNRRCIDHKLFCDTSMNFCGDDTVTGRCTDEGTYRPEDLEQNKLSIIGPICLCLFGVLVVIFTLYFCFKSSHIRKICGLPVSSSRRSRGQLTARDVYIINVNDASGTPEEGYDYVVDYKKFAAPPEYSSLENIAEAAARYANNDNTNNTPTTTSDNQNQNGDVTDGATTSREGHSNEGFVAHEDEDLPNYDQVMTNSEQFGVNHNHL